MWMRRKKSVYTMRTTSSIRLMAGWHVQAKPHVPIFMLSYLRVENVCLRESSLWWLPQCVYTTRTCRQAAATYKASSNIAPSTAYISYVGIIHKTIFHVYNATQRAFTARCTIKYLYSV